MLASTLSACDKSSSPATPSTTTTTVTAVDVVSPAANVVIPNTNQPVKLTVKNATVTGTGSATYVFEVATDVAFANKIATKSVAEGSGGQTTATLDTLTAGDYFWRARAEAGGTPGPLTGTSKFTVGPAVTLSAPAVVSPSDNSKTSRRPTFKVKNAARSGPVGAITYKFEVATSSAFTTIVASATLSEGTSETSYTPSTDLTAGTTYFWRVTALDDTNSVSSSASDVQRVVVLEPSRAELIATAQGTSLWPGAQPTGTPGKYGLGPGWEIRDRVSYDGQPYKSPPIEALRLFDLMDRGMEPDPAINWLAANGYPSTGQWYSASETIGIPHVYLALIGGSWELVHRAGG